MVPRILDDVPSEKESVLEAGVVGIWGWRLGTPEAGIEIRGCHVRWG